MKMNGKKILSLVGATLISIPSLFANNEQGIDYYRAELYDAAKIFFMKQTNQSTQEKAENYYYLGQTYYELQKKDSAAYYYQKSIETDTEYPFGYIGEGKIALSNGDKKGAEALFKKANGFAKKDPSIQTTVAEVYIDAKMYPEAEDALSKARKANKNYSGIYVAEGDMLMEQGKVGEASARYENAIHFDKSDKVAHLKLARVYKSINTDEALKYLDELVTMDPNYIPAYAELGDINYSTGFYGKAIEAYEKFIAIPGVPLEQHAKYAQLLYFTDQYDKSLNQIKYVLQKDPSNFVMHRLEAYNNFKLDNIEVGTQQMQTFLNTTAADKHIALDYLTYGRLLLKNKQPELAIENFLKAAEMGDVKSEVYKEIANAYESAGNYPEAVVSYEKYFEAEQTPVVFDFFYYGQACYYAASELIPSAGSTLTPEQQEVNNQGLRTYVEKGDKAFAEVISRSPESYLGFLWRARINSFLDVAQQAATGKMDGAAKTMYEEAINMMLARNEDGSRTKDIIEGYRYLGSYYILLDDTPNAGEMYKKILELDPANEMAKSTLDALKIKY